MEIGALPLPLSLLEQALDARTMDLLDPARVCIGFSCQAGVGLEQLQEELLVPAGEEVNGGESKGAVWGICTAVGQPLHVTMEVLPFLALKSRIL